jgi:hypothetical protein
MEDNKTDLFKVFDFATARVPIIEEQIGLNQRTPWVFYGIANLAPQELIRLYNSSPTHRASTMSKWYGVRGESISLKDGDNGRLQMANSLGDSIYDIWNKATLDFILYGAFSLNIVWRRDRDMGFEIYSMDTSKLRAERSDINDHVNNYYYCSDWALYRKFTPRKLPAFNVQSEEPSQVYYYTTHSPGNEYYATPTYWGGATAISTEIEVYNWWHSNIINGLNPSLFVSLNGGIPAAEERQQIYETLTAKYSSSNNPGKLMLTFANNKDEAAEITQISPNGSDKMWIEMNTAVQQAILTSHQISSPELLGIQTPGALGTPDHLQAQSHFFNLVIKPIQEEIKKVLEKLLTLRDGKPTEIEIQQFEIITMPDLAPVREASDTVDVNKDITDTNSPDETSQPVPTDKIPQPTK